LRTSDYLGNFEADSPIFKLDLSQSLATSRLFAVWQMQKKQAFSLIRRSDM
jgi:hypothetical protein